MNIPFLNAIRMKQSAGSDLVTRLRLEAIDPVRRHTRIFWDWWMQELQTWFPEPLRIALAQRNQQDFLTLSKDVLILRRGTREDAVEIGRIDLAVATPVIVPGGRRPTTLVLAADQVLSIPLTLPVATEENLRDVLAFEIPRKTPFTTEQVYFDFQVISRNSRTIRLDLMVTPRQALDTALEQLQARDIDVIAVNVAGSGHGKILPVDMLQGAKQISKRSPLENRQNVKLGAAALLLLLITVAVPIYKKHTHLRAVDARVAEAAGQARETIALREEVERLTASTDQLVSRKTNGRSILEILDELTRTLPDGTWISQLHIGPVELQLQGISESAGGLVSLLEGSPAFAKVAFRSPITQNPNTGEERFHLAAARQTESSHE